jgi:excisionase family DNA binding protein
MEKIYSKREAAKVLGVSLSTINRLIVSGKLRKIKVTEKRVGITEQDLREYIASCNLRSVEGNLVYRRYFDEQAIVEIPLEEALSLLRINYKGVSDFELTEMLNSFLQTPGALYSFKRENVE